jgi:protein TonB
MQVLHRIALPFINATFITLGLLAMMYSLVHTDTPALLPAKAPPVLRFAPIHEDPDVNVRQVKPKEPVLIEDTPPVIQKDWSIDTDLDELTPTWIDVSPPAKGNLELPASNQLTMAMGFPPVYPPRAITSGTEGYAVVGFSVSPAGEVFDAYVIESEPGTLFDRAALNAIKKFRYRARTVNDKPVATAGQQYMFRFELE